MKWPANRVDAKVPRVVVRPRALALAVPLLLASCAAAVAASLLIEPDVLVESDASIELEVASADAIFPDNTPLPVVPAESGPRIDLQEVWWTVPYAQKTVDLASRWGFRRKALAQLNPGLSNKDRVAAGSRFLVFRENPEQPTRSRGAPNRGRLSSGIPLPEGDHWDLRVRRHRAFGTRVTIEALLKALNSYGDEYPGAPPIRVGDISARTGGRVFPHQSHRTGRDVDLGYVLTKPHKAGQNWTTATKRNFDAEKTWFFVRTLVETGAVQQLFVSSDVQRMLLREAKKDLTDDELRVFFRAKNKNMSEHTIIRPWRGHRDHMHVRFACTVGNPACVSRSRSKKKKRNKKKKR